MTDKTTVITLVYLAVTGTLYLYRIDYRDTAALRGAA